MIKHNTTCMCGGNTKLNLKALVKQVLHDDEEFTVETEALECVDCGKQYLVATQSDLLRYRVSEAYRAKHGLLSASDIKFKVAQVGPDKVMAALGLDSKQLKRLLTWQWQTKEQDTILRNLTGSTSGVSVP